MSNLEELIERLCPDGVEYKTLTELFDTKNGYTPSKSKEEYWTNGTVPWFRMEDIRENGNILSKAIQYVSESAIKGSLFPADSIIVATSATIGQHALIKVPSLANQRFTYLVLKDEFKEQIDIMFIYYCCFKLDEYCKECLNQGNFASVDMKKFLKFKFPVPPLEVQREIVRILDNFAIATTEIQQKLQEELAARQKQYEYYRDLLLTFKSNESTILNERTNELELSGAIRWMKLGDITKFTYGYTDKAKDFGNARFIRITDITEDGCLNSQGAKYINLTADSKKYLLNYGDLLLARTGATYGKTLYFSSDIPAVYASFLIKITLDNNIISNRFYWHFSKSRLYWEQAEKLVSQGGQQQFNTNAVSRVNIPVPPLEVQQRIVDILDRFDTLCNDISSGLPAEIEMRQKQYEYYRDKLLTFKELKKEA